MYWPYEFFNRSAKSFDIQELPRAWTFVNNIFATTCGMHATKSTQHLLNHLRASVNISIHSVAFNLSSTHAASFKPLHPFSLTQGLTLSYSCSCTDAAATGRHYAKETKGPTGWSHCKGQH